MKSGNIPPPLTLTSDVFVAICVVRTLVPDEQFDKFSYCSMQTSMKEMCWTYIYSNFSNQVLKYGSLFSLCS